MTNAPRIDDALLRAIETHCRSTTEREVGGILVGTIADGRAVVTASIPALKAVAGSSNVTFTHDVWEDVLRTVDADHPGQQIVGWYHSHPGFGVFMSEYDEFAHTNFFPDPAMVALVVDPVRGEAGWFAGRTVIQIDRYELEPMESAHAAAARTVQRRSNASTTVLAIIVAALAGAVVGWLVAPDGTASRDRQISALATENQRQQADAAIDARVAERVEKPALRAVDDEAQHAWRYTTVEGDALEALSLRFFGRATDPTLLERNPDLGEEDPGALAAGLDLLVYVEPIPTTTSTASPDASSTSAPTTSSITGTG